MEPLREIHGFKKRDEDQLNGKVLDLSAKSVFSIIVALFRRTLTFLGDRKGGGASRSSMFQWYSTVESKMSTGSIYIYMLHASLHQLMFQTQVITKLLYLYNQGQAFTKVKAWLTIPKTFDSIFSDWGDRSFLFCNKTISCDGRKLATSFVSYNQRNMS